MKGGQIIQKRQTFMDCSQEIIYDVGESFCSRLFQMEFMEGILNNSNNVRAGN